MEKSIASAILAYTIHYGAIKLYSHLCVPDGMMGFLQGLVTTGSPVCHIALKIVIGTEISYTTVLMMGVTRVIVDKLIKPAELSAAAER
jgi:hypothetical protein